jgi:hypothetical protein
MRDPLGDAARQREGAPPPAWLQGLISLPGVNVVVGVVRSWWAQHPLRVAVTTASEAANVVVQPFAQRHPVALVAGAALFGALLAYTRPWRVIHRLTRPAGVWPHVFARAVALAPAQSWVAALGALTAVHLVPSAAPVQREGPV